MIQEWLRGHFAITFCLGLMWCMALVAMMLSAITYIPLLCNHTYIILATGGAALLFLSTLAVSFKIGDWIGASDICP